MSKKNIASQIEDIEDFQYQIGEIYRRVKSRVELTEQLLFIRDHETMLMPFEVHYLTERRKDVSRILSPNADEKADANG